MNILQKAVPQGAANVGNRNNTQFFILRRGMSELKARERPACVCSIPSQWLNKCIASSEALLSEPKLTASHSRVGHGSQACPVSDIEAKGCLSPSVPLMLAWNYATLRTADAAPESGNMGCQVRPGERGAAGGVPCLGLFCCSMLGLWDPEMHRLLVTQVNKRQQARVQVRQG